MGPKKEKKESFPEPKSKDWLIDDPINTDSWKCVAMLGVERTFYDNFAMKEFAEESIKGRRQEVSVIDFETLVLKVIQDFANGELPYKYKFLLNFSSTFQEAVPYIKHKQELPTEILAKIVKILLLNIKEDCMNRSQNFGDKYMDPIKAMLDRPSYVGDTYDKKKEVPKKGTHGLKLKPPSATKLDTKLLKRGERAKDDQCIDDAPRNAYFDHYVLLTSFYNPEFPLELIKAGIPLHGVLCIDTSRSGVKWDTSNTVGRLSRRNTELKAKEIQNFWTGFLKKIWDPSYSYYFRDTVFQMYVPRRLKCDRENLRKFLYKEISYLMYDLSDLKRQLNNYLSHIRLCSVARKDSQCDLDYIGPDYVPNECVNAPIILQCIINSICNSNYVNCDELSLFSESEDSDFPSQDIMPRLTPSMQATHGSSYAGYGWELDLEERGDYNLLSLYYKIKELDILYDLDKKAIRSAESDKAQIEISQSEATCKPQPATCCENLEKALLASDSIIHSFWKKYKLVNAEVFNVDYCLYANLMTKIDCSYQDTEEYSTPMATSCSSTKKNDNFEAIENLGAEMRKPHFTVTDGSRSIIKCIPYNVKSTSRDFFCPDEFKVVSPAKLKASSAPQFRTPSLKVKPLCASEIFSSSEISENPYESLKGFVSDCIFSQTIDFDCIEFLSKTKLLEQEKALWMNYNCIDHIYCLFNDCILLMIHNRKDGQNFQHETFNQKLRTVVGLRDFYDYVQEDEAEWLSLQEESYQTKVFLSNKVLDSNSLRDFTDSDFWLPGSLKNDLNGTGRKKNQETRSHTEVKIAYSSIEKLLKPIEKSFELVLDEEDLDGFDLSDMAVQFSGLKTVYLSEDCSVAVQLIERLYGNQELGVHVTQSSHSLHLYSYVCPEPHLKDPFTFHVVFKNGIVVAFSRRLFEVLEDVQEVAESAESIVESYRSKTKTRSMSKTKSESRSRSRSMTRSKSRSIIQKVMKDEDFWYDSAASLPNGLCIRVVRKHVQPCYIKQYYIDKINEVDENCRLFLPNGEVVKMMNDNTVQILKPSSSIITAKLRDLRKDEETQLPSFSCYEVLSEEGVVSEVEGGVTRLMYRYQIFHNKDSSRSRTFFRRRDGSNYMLDSDGSFCIAFKDGTKMQTTLFCSSELKDEDDDGDDRNDRDDRDDRDDRGDRDDRDDRDDREDREDRDDAAAAAAADDDDDDNGDDNNEISSHNKENGDDDFVIVHMEVTVEHPNYATVIYNSETMSWKILLPNDSSFIVRSEGFYTVNIDQQTVLNVEGDVIRLDRMPETGQNKCSFRADLSVFETKEEVYCRLKDHKGKTFVVEKNSNCYVCDMDKNREKVSRVESLTGVALTESLTDTTNMQSGRIPCKEKGNKLYRENKYVALRRDFTGMEILHVEDLNKALKSREKGSLLFIQNLPVTKNRCFVLISPVVKKASSKWRINTILPNPVFERNSYEQTISSTYGVPPTWMHPFPKKKKKFVVPEPLTCRVFIETKKTKLSPSPGSLDCYFCTLDELPEIKHSQIPTNGVETYLKRLANDNQQMLKEMYTLVALSVINEKKKLVTYHTDKLEKYLKNFQHKKTMSEYYKNCIRYHIIPKYFDHPRGMSWSILHDLICNLELTPVAPEEEEEEVEVAQLDTLSVAAEPSTSSSTTTSLSFSNTEVEYNLSVNDEQSLSELSCRSNLPIKSAPGILRNVSIRCRVKPVRKVFSSPEVNYLSQVVSDLPPVAEGLRLSSCAFQKDVIEMLEKPEFKQYRKPPMSLEDLMYLGLI